ncbi:MAG: EF-hand domain-containing protein [Burkholderiales bacterium]|nr:EF-hand domain-containing protein [Burkholderiales bacterium]
MKSSFALSLIAVALLPAAVLAQSSPQASSEARPDGGRPDPERMRQMFEERFKKADTNGDGALTRAEAEQGMPRIAENFAAIDTNGDGKVTPEEIRAAMERRRAATAEGSGQTGSGVSPGAGSQGAQAGPRGPRGPGASRGPEGGRPSREQMRAGADDMFKKADSDGDGVLSEDEAARASPMLAQNFAAMDTNRDGQLSREEMRAYRMKQRREGAGRPPAPEKGEAPK